MAGWLAYGPGGSGRPLLVHAECFSDLLECKRRVTGGEQADPTDQLVPLLFQLLFYGHTVVLFRQT
jgi:hypothetical protein